MTPPDAMSTAEISRHLGRIEATLTHGFAEIKSDLDKYVLKSVHEAEMRGVAGQIRDVEEDLKDALTRQRWAIGIGATAVLSLAGSVIALLNFVTPHI